MNSLLIPSNISVSVSTSYLTIAGPKGSFTISIKGFNFNLRDTTEGQRLVVSPLSTKVDKKTPISTILSLIVRRIEGISIGYRHRLRLVGVGFRATTSDNSIILKIGYSHDVSLNVSDFSKFGVSAKPSNIDGRTKGTILQFESNNPRNLFHQINRIQRFRRPDPYKAKGIHIDGKEIRRKKGKREA